MKFTCTTEINLPLNRVVELFDNTDNLRHWQEGLQHYKHLTGKPGQPGATAEIVIHSGKHIIELLETIIENNLPNHSTALYEHKHMVNTMTNRFTAIGENKTRYETEIHYTKFIGFVPKAMALLMPGVFRKQVQTTIERFKNFAENSSRVSD